MKPYHDWVTEPVKSLQGSATFTKEELVNLPLGHDAEQSSLRLFKSKEVPVEGFTSLRLKGGYTYVKKHNRCLHTIEMSWRHISEAEA